jgi:tetratricopeptide (TPR) repeat protein
VVVVAAALVAAVRATVPAQAAARAARRAMARGEWDAAAAALDRWLALRPEAAEVHFLKAQACFQLGQVAEAEHALDRAQWLGYPERPLYRLRALILVRRRRFIAAEPILLHLLDESPEPDAPVDEALTRVFLETYRLDSAVKVIRRWIRDAPRDPKPYLWWTEVDRRLEVDNPEAMERHYRTALELDPGLDEARLGLAETLRHLHQTDEAILEYQRYVARHPADAAGHVGLARLALEQGDAAAATRHIERALEIAPENPTALTLRADIDLRRGDDAAAVRRLDQAIRADPLDVDPLYKRCLVLSRLGRSEAAAADRLKLEQLRKDQVEVVKIRDRLIADPDNNEIRFEMARWMLEHGRDDEAIRWMQNILASQPGHLPTLRLLTQYYERRGEMGLANYYRSLAESTPESPRQPEANPGDGNPRGGVAGFDAADRRQKAPVPQ